MGRRGLQFPLSATRCRCGAAGPATCPSARRRCPLGAMPGVRGWLGDGAEGGWIISAWVPLCSYPAAGPGHRPAQERRSGQSSLRYREPSSHHPFPPLEPSRVRGLEEGFSVVSRGFQGSPARARTEHPVRTSWCSRPFLLKEERNRID